LHRPSSSLGYAAYCAISGYQRIHCGFFDRRALAALQLKIQGPSFLFQRHKPAAERYLCATSLGGGSQITNQFAAFDYEVGMAQTNSSYTSVGE
jgi:hypothetical protein